MTVVLFAIMTLLFLRDIVSNWRQTRKARQFVYDCHGDLPPLDRLATRNFSTPFLAELMRLYIKDASERARRRPASSGPPPKALPLDPETEPDCPECANGVPHEVCRRGWKDVLRANTVFDALDRIDTLVADKVAPPVVVDEGATVKQLDAFYQSVKERLTPRKKWVPPCDTCGSNCGQCGSSHCGICGVKPRDGECNQEVHAQFKREYPNGRT